MRGRALLLGALVWALIVSFAPQGAAENAPPEVVINTPDHGSTVSGTVVISGNAWDHDGTVLGVKVHIDAGEWWMATDTSGNGTWWSWETEWDTTTVPDGWHGIGAIAWDNASAHGDARIEVKVLNGGENTKPWVAIDEPPNHSTVRNITTVKGRAGDEDPDDTVELVQVRIDDRDWINATPTGDNGSFGHWAYDWNTSEVDDGWHAFSARAWDGTAYSLNVEYEYLVDNVEDPNVAPWVEIVDPKGGQTVWGTVLVHGEAGDANPGDRVELVEVRIGNGSWNVAVDTSHNGSYGTWAWQWDTTAYENNVTDVCARSYDGELYSEVHCREVKVHNENHRPTVHILHPANGETVKGLLLIHGTAADDVAVELVEVRFGDGEWRTTTDTSPDGSWATWAYEWDTRTRDDGCVWIGARSYDGALFSEVHSIKVCVDNVNNKPWVKIYHPMNEENVSGLYLVHGMSEDDHGVKKVQVRIDDGEWELAVNTGRERPWGTWAFEWDTTEYENGKHVVCARAWDGELYSDLSCRHVNVHNEGDGAPPEPWSGPTPYISFGLLAGLGATFYMWLRSHGFVRK